MSQETLSMSSSERKRLVLMHQVVMGELLLKEAAWELGVSLRQAVRIRKRFVLSGAAGLVHQSRGMPSNRRKPSDLREQILAVYRERYEGFGPTLAAEKLLEYEAIVIKRETLRRWLIADKQWQTGVAERTHRQKRRRRERFGEMLQIDGSDHAWFEKRGAKCTLMVLVDDATGRVALHMGKSETTHDALIVLHKWVKTWGVPVSIYADRRTVYFTETFVQDPERRNDPKVFTDFMKVTDRLGIEMIPAYSPQAKGRVERINGTLQDRLVKELRLRGIHTIEEANEMLDSYAEEINRRFARPPAKPADAHRSCPRGKEQWDYYFCREESRVVQKDNTVCYKNEQWQILQQTDAPRPGASVTLRHPVTGGILLALEGEAFANNILGASAKVRHDR
jgi:hypothetical protein